MSSKSKTRKIHDWFLAIDTRAWFGNQALRRCSATSRLVFIELLMWMRDGSPDRGVLLNEMGEPPDLEWIAETCRVQRDQAESSLEELTARGVLKQNDAGCFHSPRMLRAESRREQASLNGRAGRPSNRPDQGPNLGPKEATKLGPDLGPSYGLGWVELGSVSSPSETGPSKPREPSPLVEVLDSTGKPITGQPRASERLPRMPPDPRGDPFGMRSDNLLRGAGVALTTANSSNLRELDGQSMMQPRPAQRFAERFGYWHLSDEPQPAGPWAEIAVAAWNRGARGMLQTEPPPSPATVDRERAVYRYLSQRDIMPEDIELMALGLSTSAHHRGANGWHADLTWAVSPKGQAHRWIQIGRQYRDGTYCPPEEQEARKIADDHQRMLDAEARAARARAIRRGEITDGDE